MKQRLDHAIALIKSASSSHLGGLAETDAETWEWVDWDTVERAVMEIDNAIGELQHVQRRIALKAVQTLKERE